MFREVVLVAPRAGEVLEETAGPAFAIDSANPRGAVGSRRPPVRITVIVLRSLYGIHPRRRSGFRIAGLLVVDGGRHEAILYVRKFVHRFSQPRIREVCYAFAEPIMVVKRLARHANAIAGCVIPPRRTAG